MEVEGAGDELLVDGGAFGGGVVDGDFDVGVGLKFGDDVEASSAACAFEGVVRIGDDLEFVEDEAWDDDEALEDLGVGDVEDAAIDDGGGIEEHRSGAAYFFVEFDVGDDEPEVVFGLEDDGDCDEDADDADESFDALCKCGVVAWDGEIDEVDEE